jgi:hypothetical protein
MSFPVERDPIHFTGKTASTASAFPVEPRIFALANALAKSFREDQLAESSKMTFLTVPLFNGTSRRYFTQYEVFENVTERGALMM